MNFIVLVKQVPDISNIPIDAWDKEKGTLKRGMLDNVTNPLDLNALSFAYRIREQFGYENSKILCLTMGPLHAREVLIDCLSRGADEGVLLTDQEFAGSDTAATSYTIAQAIRKIEEIIFKNKKYLIISGMQSVDGDTAQVPPQVAEELGIEHIAYAHSFHIDEQLVVKRIGPNGMETVYPKEYPVLITVTGCIEPLYKSFYMTRQVQKKTIYQWGAKEINVDKNRIGLKGSRTQVYKIFSPGEQRNRKCVFIDDIDKLISLIEENYQNVSNNSYVESKEFYNLDDKVPSYTGEVWVYIEHGQDIINPASLELTSKAKELSIVLGQKMGAVLIGENVKSFTNKLIVQGADKVYMVEHSLLKNFLPIPYKKTIASLVRKYKPQILLFGATPLGRELAPRVAYNTDSGLTADCTNLEIGDYERGKNNLIGILKQTRPALGGNIMATIFTKSSVTQMATVRPGVFRIQTPDLKKTGEIIISNTHITANDVKTKISSIELFPPKTTLSSADIIISGGLGLGSKLNFENYLFPLADAFKKLLNGETEIGASRMAVEYGFVGSSCQVGQTGQTVNPRLYVAVGISGAVQHITGMQNSKIIVAINKDVNAQIFDYADYGVIGNIEKVIPKIIEAIDKRARLKNRKVA